MLTPQEVTQLASILENLTSMGKSIVFITHKLEEVMMMTQRVTVMRDGAVIGTLATRDTDRGHLARFVLLARSARAVQDRGYPRRPADEL